LTVANVILTISPAHVVMSLAHAAPQSEYPMSLHETSSFSQ